MALFMGGGPHLNTWKEKPHRVGSFPLSKNDGFQVPGSTFQYLNSKDLPECRQRVLGSELGSFPSTRTQHRHPRFQEAAHGNNEY